MKLLSAIIRRIKSMFECFYDDDAPARFSRDRNKAGCKKCEGYGGMPRPPRKPEPVPQPGDEGKE